MFKLIVSALIVCVFLTQYIESAKIVGLTEDELQSYGNVPEFKNHVVVVKRQTRVCEPGRSFKKDCNTCVCNDDGTSAACTLIGCISSAGNTYITRTALNTMFKLVLCSLILVICLSQVSESFKLEYLENATPAFESQDEFQVRSIVKRENEKCTPGERVQVQCNTCVCGSNGELETCTLKGCPSTGDGGNTLLVKVAEGSS
ncbi:uncharacterized protein LOC123293018 [Chrysoperla carnea]|uniref:uncharacterized protein LOC123293018 n=1 Tax=Chrysoperla carnea TaxID=189513 RepID=UPI001D080491|nr:uncharacterized protein LOC123293018 [Chrysoperla carnea]